MRHVARYGTGGGAAALRRARVAYAISAFQLSHTDRRRYSISRCRCHRHVTAASNIDIDESLLTPATDDGHSSPPLTMTQQRGSRAARARSGYSSYGKGAAKRACRSAARRVLERRQEMVRRR